MSDDRKYKQRGYQEPDRPAAPSRPSGGSRSAFTAYKETVRCDSCGAEVSIHFEIGFESRCPKCQSQLHTCRNCLNLSPGSRYDCSRPVAERVEDKQGANRCPSFEARRIRIKETTFSTAPRPEDAKKALENLFRRKK